MIYPSADIEKSAAASRACQASTPRALILSVDEMSPAWDAGFEPGCFVTTVDGSPVRDIIDWRWLTDGDCIEVGYIDLDGEEGTVQLQREEGESWGFQFDGALFDSVKTCRNGCIFCFMQQLPADVRNSLVLRDDDFRLSFLQGTFVTLTNLSAADEQRIVEQFISPLRVSLHASNPEVRRRIIGKHADWGMGALERLLKKGIQVHAQIVLMPGINDGEVLRETLEWAWQHPNILSVGIVPLGFTKHQSRFEKSFGDPDDAQKVIDAIRPFQQKARQQRGNPWVYAADEFYGNAFGADTPQHVPPASDYGDYEMFEDGIGIIRSYVDEFYACQQNGLMGRCAQALTAAGIKPLFIIGEAMQPFLDKLLEESPLAGHLRALTVPNRYFGGNVTVTGLLTGEDIATAIAASQEDGPFLVPSVVLNHDGVTLDDMTVSAIEKAAGKPIAVVSCNPNAYLHDIIALAENAR